MPFAIETIDLVKKYPTRSKTGGTRGGRGIHGGRRVDSYWEIFSSLLKKHPGTFIEALRGINLQIKDGEIFGLLGPNGAGKTTLIKILCTLVIHDEGKAYVHGFDVKKDPENVLKNLQAILPESRGFDWRLTGRQNLEFYALLYGVRDQEARERINYLLDFTGLKDRADDGYQRYSTGMQRKLLLCRALLRNTPTLLFDEPTSGLDPTSAAEFRGLLRNRLSREEGKTVLVSTHNLNEAQEICDRVAILNRGKILACDTPRNIQHTVFDNQIFSIVFVDTLFGPEQEKMLGSLKTVLGVIELTPQISSTNFLQQLTVQIKRNTDISGILKVIAESGLKVSALNTGEPTLEDVFIRLTGSLPG